MRGFRRIFLLIFSAVLICTIFTLVSNLGNHAENLPYFGKNSENIVVNLDHYKEELLNSVKAFDSSGNDISDSVFVKSIVKTEGKENFKVTYIAFDADGNSAEYETDAVIRGYIPPRLNITAPMSYSLSGTGYIADAVTVTDVFDGDITYKLRVVASDMDNDVPGIYTVLVQVQNSVGDSIMVPLKALVRPQSGSGYSMTLTQNVVYAERGAQIHPQDYIKDFHCYDSVSQMNIPVSDSDYQILTIGDPQSDVYYIVYYIPDTSNIGWPTDDSGRQEVFFNLTSWYDYVGFKSMYSSDEVLNLKFKSAVVLTVFAEE